MLAEMDHAWVLNIFLLLFRMMTFKGEELKCSLNNNITVKFTVDPPDPRAFWRRNGVDLRDVELNTAGDGCLPPILPTPAGYEFDCKTENNKSVYILKFKSKISDSGIVFTLAGVQPERTFTYIPDATNYTNCINNTGIGQGIVCKVDCYCLKSSLSWKYRTENQAETSFTIPNNDPIPCGVENFYKLDINVSADDILNQLPGTLIGQVNVTGTLTIGDENYQEKVRLWR